VNRPANPNWNSAETSVSHLLAREITTSNFTGPTSLTSLGLFAKGSARGVSLALVLQIITCIPLTVCSYIFARFAGRFVETPLSRYALSGASVCTRFLPRGLFPYRGMKSGLTAEKRSRNVADFLFRAAPLRTRTWPSARKFPRVACIDEHTCTRRVHAAT